MSRVLQPLNESTIPGGEPASVLEDSDGLTAVAASLQHAPWQALSALASEYAHAVRHPFGQSGQPSQTGSVQQDPQTTLAQTDLTGGNTDLGSVDVRTENGQADRSLAMAVDTQEAGAEAARVAAKFVAKDGSTAVILRFDFMRSKDTRVIAARVLRRITLPCLVHRLV